MANFVASATFQDNLSAGMNAATAALEKGADAADNLTVSLTKAGPSATKLANTLDPTTKATTNLSAAQDKLTAAISTMDAAVSTGSKTIDQRNAVIDALSVKVQAAKAAVAALTGGLDDSTAAYNSTAAAIAKLADANARATQYQTALNQALNVQSSTADSYASRAADIDAYGRSLDTLRAKYDPLFAVSKQYEASLNEIAYAESVGALSANQATAARDNLTAAFGAANAPLAQNVTATNAVTASHGAASIATRQFGVQITQLISGIATGQPVLTSFIQQGHQVGDVMLSTGTSAGTLGKYILALITPTVAAVAAGAALVAGLAYLGYESNATQGQLLALQNSLRATRDDFVDMAAEATAAGKAVAQMPGFSSADTHAAAQTLSSNPSFQGSTGQLENLIRVAGDAATALGVTLPQEAQVFADAMTAPGKAADDMANKHLFGFNQALADSITLQANAGDAAGAYGRLIDQVKSHVDGATQDALTPMQLALQNIDKAFGSADTGETWSKAVGKNINDNITGALTAVTSAINFVKSFSGNASAGQTFAQIQSQGVQTWLPGANMLGAGAFPSGLSANSASLINQYAGQLGLPANITAFAGRVAMQESGGQQFNSQGGVLTSSAGAQGMFQLMPGTASDLGVDATNPDQNVAGGLADIAILWNKYGGNPTLVAMAYNWGQGNVDAFLAGNKTLSQVPAETQAYVKAVAPNGPDIASLAPATIDVTGGVNAAGVTNSPQSIIDQALKATGDTPAATAENADAQVKLYTSALAALAAQGDTTSVSVAEISQKLQEANAVLYNALPALQATVRGIDQNIAEQTALAAAYTQGQGAINNVTAANQAYAQALSDHLVPGTQAFAAAMADLTQKDLAQQQAAAQVDTNKQIYTADQQTQAQLAVNAAYDGTQTSITHAEAAAKAYQAAISAGLVPGTDAFTDAVTRLSSAYDQGAAATQSFQQAQQSVEALTGALGNAFDQLSQGITDALLETSGQAVNWGNIIKAVMASVITEIAKLAVVNPIINSVFGQTNPTLGSALSVIGGGSSSSTGSSLSSLSSLYSAGKSVYSLFNGSGTGSSFINGLGDATGLFGAGIPDISGASAAQIAAATAPNGLLSESAVAGELGGGSAPATGGGLLGGTLSGYLGGIGGGFAAGSLAGGLIQGALNKTGPAPEIGAGVGAVGGALAGTLLFPGVGTVLGGILGGLLGGSGGGFIGPKPAGVWTSVPITTQNGMLAVGGSVDNGVPLAGDGQSVDAELQSQQQEIDQLNAVLQAGGIQINSTGGYNEVGQTSGSASLPSDKGSDISDIFSSFKFGSSTDPTLNNYLQNNSFDNLQDLQTAVTNYNTLVQQTIPALTAQTTVTGSLTDQLTAINTAYDAAITSAQQYGVATDALTASQTKAVQAAQDAAYQQLAQTNATFQGNYLSAAATISGSPQDAETSALYNFDQQAQQQRDQFSASLTSTYGDAYATTQNYALEMASLERSLGEQRLAIQTQYNDQILQSANGVITNLSQYVVKLQTGSNSPLSPIDQYNLASSQFSTDASAAAGGDYTSISNLTNDADTFLGASRAVNGSGAAYVSDFNSVLDALQNLSSMTPDQLTASIFQASIQGLNASLSAGLASVQAEVAALRLTVQQGSSAPARLS